MLAAFMRLSISLATGPSFLFIRGRLEMLQMTFMIFYKISKIATQKASQHSDEDAR
jgi:hypothetical protein